MSKENNIILGSTSLWTLPLLYHSFIEKYYILSLILGLISIISPLYWYKNKEKSIYDKLDKYLSISCFIYISLEYYYIIEKIKLYISNSSFLLLFYILSYKFGKSNKYDLQLYSYLLFRWYFFALIFNLIIKKEKYFENCKSLYFANNLYLTIITFNNKNYDYKKSYILACFYTITSIIINEFLFF